MEILSLKTPFPPRNAEMQTHNSGSQGPALSLVTHMLIASS